MNPLVSCLIFSCVIFSAFGAPALPNQETELILVSVIFRHGARTTYSFYPTDPNQGADFYPVGMGGLTNEGKMGEFVLGEYLHSLYADLIGPEYVESEVYVRSTDVTRTKMSAQLVLAGLFPPSEIQQWNKDLMWQPIPVQYKTESEEDLFHPWGTCPYKANFINHLPDIPEVQEKYIEPYQDVFDFVEEKSGKTINHPSDMVDFYFILKTESDMDLIMPDWTQEIFPEPVQTIGAQVYGYHNYDARVRQINSGYMLKKILDDSKRKIDGDSGKKIYLYSGHESTVGYMLNALSVYKPEVPPYGSAISFEIHKAGDDYFIKLRYRNATDGMIPVDLAIPGCDIMCPFDQFVELQKDLIPTVSIQDACKEEETDGAFI